MRDFSATGPDQTREADDLASTNTERDLLLWIPAGLQFFNLKVAGCFFSLRLLVKLFELAPNHHFHHAVVSNLLTRQRSGIRAVAQDYHAIGDLFNFVEAV